MTTAPTAPATKPQIETARVIALAAVSLTLRDGLILTLNNGDQLKVTVPASIGLLTRHSTNWRSGLADHRPPITVNLDIKYQRLTSSTIGEYILIYSAQEV